MNLSTKTLRWIVGCLFALEALNIAADVLVSSYVSNGGINFAFNALITALVTDRLIFKKRSEKMDSEKEQTTDDQPSDVVPRGDPDGSSPRHPVPQRVSATTSASTFAKVVIALSLLFCFISGGVYFKQTSDNKKQNDRNDQLSKENAVLILQVKAVQDCLVKWQKVDVENRSSRSAANTLKDSAQDKLLLAFGRFSPADSADEVTKQAQQLESRRLFDEYTQQSAEADLQAKSNPILPFPDCKEDSK